MKRIILAFILISRVAFAEVVAGEKIDYGLEGERFATQLLSEIESKSGYQDGLTFAESLVASQKEVVSGVEIKDKQITKMKHKKVQSGLFAFVSLSMPKDSLKQIISQVKKVGGRVVIRGFSGSIKETVKQLNGLGQVSIDPKLFKEFEVKAVPVFVVSDDKSGYDIAAGNVSLDFVLREFAKSGDSKGIAAQYLSKLEEKE